MASSVKDKEYNKFRTGKDGDPAVGVVYDGSNPLPVETSGVEWDEIVTTFPAAHQDLFTYKKNNIAIQTVLVTYDNGTKKQILLVQKTRL